MKMRMRNMLIVSGLCVCMCGCGNKVTETKNESTQAAEDVAQTTEKSKQMKTEDYFPETYSEQTEKVKLNKIAARWPAKAVVQFLISFLKKQ